MDEWNYILSGDLHTLRAAEVILKDVIAANNKHIPEDEYKQVMTLLFNWRESMFDEINAAPVEKGPEQ